MNLQENIQRIRVLIEQTKPVSRQIFVDMGGVLFSGGTNDPIQQGTTERPKDVKSFQDWVINIKKDNQILGKYGADGKWGNNTLNAWITYGEEYKTANPNSTTQPSNQDKFIGKSLWDNIKQHNPTILSSVGTSNQQEKIKNKTNQVNNTLGLPSNRVIFVTNGIDKAKYANGNILIDDSSKNIDAWRKAGGIGIQHKNNDETINKLNQYVS